MKLGIDIGSTSLKGVLLNAKNEILLKVYETSCSIIPTLLDFLEAMNQLLKRKSSKLFSQALSEWVFLNACS